MQTSVPVQTRFATLDDNEAAAQVTYALNEVIAIYPITPASPMGEWAAARAASYKPNLWGAVPNIVEMQIEDGIAGAVHGALQTGALTTTFTASQELLLMLSNLYKIASEFTPCVIYVAARSVVAQALSIFSAYSDVITARSTGFAMPCSASVQEAQDMAAIATSIYWSGTQKRTVTPGENSPKPSQKRLWPSLPPVVKQLPNRRKATMFHSHTLYTPLKWKPLKWWLLALIALLWALCVSQDPSLVKPVYLL